jgi:hypothetical protein
MEVFLAIAVAAVGIATLVVALSFRKRTEKQVSVLLEQSRDTAAPNDGTAINELRAQLYEGLARLDQLNAGLQTVQEYIRTSQAWGYQPDDAEAADGRRPADDGRA